MGYNINYVGELQFSDGLSDEEINKISIFLGCEMSDFPDYGIFDFYSIDLKFTDDFSGLTWDYSEKSHFMDKQINFMLDRIKEINPDLTLEGEFLCQGENITDRFKIVVSDGEAVREEIIDIMDSGTLIEKLDLFELIEKWGKEKGILDKSTPRGQFLKLIEETGELASALSKNNEEEFIDAVGDCVVVLTLLCKMQELSIKDCIQSAYDVISKRKGKMVNGVFVKNEDSLPIEGTIRVIKIEEPIGSEHCGTDHVVKQKFTNGKWIDLKDEDQNS
jgi:NTP pyrophosphatase (non-canonical NTP hydrolase)